MAKESGIALFIDARKAESGAKRFQSALGRVGRTARSTTSKVKRGFKGLASTFGGLRGVLAGVGFGLLFKQLVSVNSEFERMRGALTTITGSVADANKEFGALQEFAKQTPFTLDQSINAFIKLQNLGIKPSEERLKSFGNTAAAQGKSLSQFIEAVADASTNEFERLKEFGIKARQQGDEVAFTFQGVTTTVRKDSEEIVGYLQNIGDKNFAGAMEDQMKRLPGILSNLKDSFNRLAGEIGQGGFTEAVAEAAKTTSDMITDLIESGRAEQFGRVLGEAIKFVANTASFATTTLMNFFIGIDEAFAQISNRIAAVVQGVDFQEVNKLFEDEKAAEALSRLNATKQGGDFKIGDSLADTKREAESAAAAMVKARASLTDYIRDTRNATMELELQNRHIRDQGAAFNENSKAYVRLQAELAAEQQLREAGIPLYEKSGETLKRLTDIIFENMRAQTRLDETLQDVQARQDQAQAVRDTVTDLVQEREALVKLNDARMRGIEAYREVESEVQAVNMARRLGISLYSVEGENIRNLISELNSLQEELRDPIYRTWIEGAVDSLDKYRDAIKDVGTDVEQAMTNAVRGMEDALTGFFTNGRADFQAFAQSILQDINRILVRQLLIQPLIGALQGGFAGASGGIGGFIGGLFGAGGGAAQTAAVSRPTFPTTPLAMANGGVVSAPTLAMIGEGAGSEAVIPLRNGAVPVVMEGGGGGNYNITVNVRDESGGRIMVSARQVAQQIGAQVGRELRRERGA